MQKFGELYPGFKKLGAEVIAVSTDSIFTHLAWQQGTLGKLNHPHAADKNLLVSDMYGVLDEELGFSMRGTFIIDPKGIVKHISVNPSESGRNVQEVLRNLHAIVKGSEGNLVPCGWKSGDEFTKKSNKL